MAWPSRRFSGGRCAPLCTILLFVADEVWTRYSCAKTAHQDAVSLAEAQIARPSERCASIRSEGAGLQAAQTDTPTLWASDRGAPPFGEARETLTNLVTGTGAVLKSLNVEDPHTIGSVNAMRVSLNCAASTDPMKARSIPKLWCGSRLIYAFCLKGNSNGLASSNPASKVDAFNPATPIDLASYSRTLERPLFDPGRRPRAPITTTVVEPVVLDVTDLHRQYGWHCAIWFHGVRRHSFGVSSQ